ncbi:MAG TPA: diacylglycerol kinase family lipid kinase [Polyangiaceae bacterium]|nr:MAG: Diacylglycerol kinase [Deltaproteobacteria bacterium ADurb.Bin207]HNS96884.1 diacylglycerol kinase family lipid kinase [Polyangiaceae bacterium]HNZ24415.1 diacylglycerol kinase family lipid kinase [Polyangiaceae bacterium]HOD22479.1 diacylglycerol kinase family lipid kinase [Polyangiaceae bacterium]HOE49213.1 diacylglycerol kinase family lipid kinase [Polyangiaceae bacterium]
MSDPRVRLVFNPRAGGGAAARRLPELVDTMQRHDLSFEIARTTGPGDASRIARASFDDGVDLLAVVGGDGTLNEVVQAFLNEYGEVLEGPDIAILPMGTGGDFLRTLGRKRDLDQTVSRMRSGNQRRIDVVSLQLVDFHGKQVRKAFVNITSFGIGGVTDKLVNDAPKWLGGKASFFIGSVRAMLQYRNEHVRVVVDDSPFIDGPVFNVALANGRYFGGGMMIAPHADPSDGMLDVVSLGDMNRKEVVSLSGKIYSGKHLDVHKVTHTRGSVVEAIPHRKEQRVLLDMDGETPGMLPIVARVLPKAIRVRS